MYAVSRDYLGSIIAIADSSGRVVERRTYDPWGRMTREAADSALCITARGYTSHEHIDEIGLINMNARLYDPLIGRFFSPDPKMMDGESQALNRYSYAMNNPFAYTDPGGEELVLALISAFIFVATLTITAATAVTLGAVAGAVMTGVTLAKSGASAGEMAWKIPAAMVIGGAAGAAGAALGAGMPAFGGAAGLALSGVASVAAGSLIGSTTSFLTGANTLSVGLLYYNFNKKGLENPFGGVTQSIFSGLDIAGMVLPAVGGVASALTKAARGARLSASSPQWSPAERQRALAWGRADLKARMSGRGSLPGGRGFVPTPRMPGGIDGPLDRFAAVARYSKILDVEQKRIGYYADPSFHEGLDPIVVDHVERAREGLVVLMQLNTNDQLNLIESINELENIIDDLLNNALKNMNKAILNKYMQSRKDWMYHRLSLSQPVINPTSFVKKITRISAIDKTPAALPITQTPVLPPSNLYESPSEGDYFNINELNFW
ncbi:Cell wall-associated polypeptide CWBP200 [Bacteroidales bacterium Barb6XT]|nr:Cell wall-associated polypeptide CWBP200 [Bacteroidales bacterium Barb6XT]